MITRLLLLLASLCLLASFDGAAASRTQRTFATPEAAAQALHQAVRDGDGAAMAAVLGPGSADVIESGNPGEDMAARARFVAAFEQSMSVARHGSRRAELLIGAQQWRFPYPLVRAGGGWRFDGKAGRSEVIARRIGRNELSAMQALLAYVDAQREYALQAHDGAGPGVYAQRIASTPGRHDGLFWTPTQEHPLSPMAPMFTLAAADETDDRQAVPYHGYHFRVLRGQGAHAEGGAADYVVGGRMVGGFALLAYPARYRSTGVRTFLVSHRGTVFSRDLGPATWSAAHAMRRFDPGPGWRREVEAVASSQQARDMRHLAGARGCTLCHREGPSPRGSDGVIPLAPSWREIAARYAGRVDAETQLVRIVTEGADPGQRHWKDRLDFTAMGANAPRVSPDEARALVRWILSSPER